MAPKKEPPQPARDRLPYASAYVEHDTLRKLKQLALDEETTVADLIREGIELVFKRAKI
jgi:hypothetical protein